ncbi:MAG TPA: hypothetical protein VIY49_30880 [Bryobacteraceae bacterium]
MHNTEWSFDEAKIAVLAPTPRASESTPVVANAQVLNGTPVGRRGRGIARFYPRVGPEDRNYMMARSGAARLEPTGVSNRLSLLLLALAGSGLGLCAGSDGFMLGVDHSFDLGSYVNQGIVSKLGTDAQGYLYLLGYNYVGTVPPLGAHILGNGKGSWVAKLTPQGDQLVWFTVLDFLAEPLPLGSLAAVSPVGAVYLGYNPPSPFGCFEANDCSPVTIAQLSSDGTAVVSQTPISPSVGVSGLVTDASGRLWVAGSTDGLGHPNPISTTADALQKTIPDNTMPHGFLVRLNAAGTAIEYATYIGGSGASSVDSIAADASGAIYIHGATDSSDFPLAGAAPGSQTGFMAKFGAGETQLAYAVAVAGYYNGMVAADPNGNAVVIAQGAAGQPPVLVRLNPQGAVVFSDSLPLFNANYGSSLASDTAGRTYLTFWPGAGNYPVKNSIAPCGPGPLLEIFGPDAEILQSTWLPSGAPYNFVLVGADNAVYVLTEPLLTQLSPDAPAMPLPLVCVTDPVDYVISGPIAPGEIVSLFGYGLGPAQGVTPEVMVQEGYPTELSGVQVTFGAQPAPILYAQDGQINAVAPFSLQPGSSVPVCVSYNGMQLNCLTEQVQASSVFVFTGADGYALALNQDGTINSHENPALPGSIVTVFATGTGAINPAPRDGAIITPPLPSDVLAAGAASCVTDFPISVGPTCVSIALQYAGPAPFEVAGLTQINLVFNPQAESATISLAIGGSDTSFSIHVHGYGED